MRRSVICDSRLEAQNPLSTKLAYNVAQREVTLSVLSSRWSVTVVWRRPRTVQGQAVCLLEQSFVFARLAYCPLFSFPASKKNGRSRRPGRM